MGAPAEPMEPEIVAALSNLVDGIPEIIEAHLQEGSPAVGGSPADLAIPEGCSLFAVVRDGVATSLRPDTVLAVGDKVIAIGRADCEPRLSYQLIGGHPK